ncbi:hypothetical protein V5799_024235 [Amblyomma americanum]|uniref:Uncharacterized protein n=1 Tax=Amblyomma americanum TaxID=6943 RepID=A0AAQ4ED06_AMBAM
MCDTSKMPPLREQISDDCYTEAFLVKTPRCGSLNVHVQGDLSTINPRKPIFLTVHDVGSTYLDFVQFAAHPCMTRVCEKSVFLHVEVPGQAYNAPDLPEEFSCEYIFQSTDETSGKVTQGSSALNYAESVRQKVNRRNSSFYIQAYLTRSDISSALKKSLKTDILLVTSSTQAHADTTQTTYSKIDPAKAALLKLDDAEDILSDAVSCFCLFAYFGTQCLY